MIRVAPSILAADVLNLEKEAGRMVAAGCDWLHIDVMDAHFVPNLAYTPAVVRRLKETFDIPLDVHLMMDQPDRYLDEFLDAGADVLTVHAETGCDLKALLARIRGKGASAGLAIRPGTPAETLFPYLEQADLILAMTVEPGFGGQKLNEEVPEKFAVLRHAGYDGWIEADGGITEENLPGLIRKGLDTAVMGTALFRLADPADAIRRIHEL